MNNNWTETLISYIICVKKAIFRREKVIVMLLAYDTFTLLICPVLIMPTILKKLEDAAFSMNWPIRMAIMLSDINLSVSVGVLFLAILIFIEVRCKEGKCSSKVNAAKHIIQFIIFVSLSVITGIYVLATIQPLLDLQGPIGY